MTHDEIIAANPIGAWLQSRGVKLVQGRKRAARCPLKEHSRVGNVSIDHKQNLWHCHACNRGGTVIDWLALEKNISIADAMRELGGSIDSGPTATPKPKVAKTYDYVNEAGDLLFQCVRYEPKDFKQRRPDGAGGWLWNLQGVRLVPYRLPEVLKAIEVWIPEGEKDCDALATLGFVATCNPMGAGKWRDDYNAHFAGKRVVIIPDNDKPGQEHADAVARALHGIAASVKIVRLLDSVKDVSDFIATFPDKTDAAERLALLAEGAGEYQPDATPPTEKRTGLVIVNAMELVNTTFPDTEDIVAGIWPTKARLILSAPAKLGKTRFMLGMALAIATCKNALGFTITKPRRVFYVQAELSGRSLHERLKKMLAAYPYDEKLVRENLFFCNDPRLKLTHEVAVQAIREVVELHRPEVVVFDPLYKFNTGSEDKVQDMTRFFDPLDALIYDFGVAVALVHHHGKGRGENLSTTAHLNRGSSTIADWPDSLLTLQFEDAANDIVKLTFTLRNAEEPEPKAFERNRETLWFDPLPDYVFTSKGTATRITDNDVAETIGAGREIEYTHLAKELVEKFDVSLRTAKSAIKRAADAAVIVKNPDGLYERA